MGIGAAARAVACRLCCGYVVEGRIHILIVFRNDTWERGSGRVKKLSEKILEQYGGIIDLTAYLNVNLDLAKYMV